MMRQDLQERLVVLKHYVELALDFASGDWGSEISDVKDHLDRIRELVTEVDEMVEPEYQQWLEDL